MKDKNWALILMGIILLASFAVFFAYEKAIEKSSKIGYEKGYKVGYNNKICEICEDNYDEGYNSCQQEYEERVDYCFEICKYQIMIVGEPSHADCLWNCLNPDSPNLDELCKGSPITWCGPDKTGQWEIINNKCQWICKE